MDGKKHLKQFLDAKVVLYNQPSFIEKDPISVPHSFTKKQDIEISGLLLQCLRGVTELLLLITAKS
jgi:hypothetical protein